MSNQAPEIGNGHRNRELTPGERMGNALGMLFAVLLGGVAISLAAYVTVGIWIEIFDLIP